MRAGVCGHETRTSKRRGRNSRQVPRLEVSLAVFVPPDITSSSLCPRRKEGRKEFLFSPVWGEGNKRDKYHTGHLTAVRAPLMLTEHELHYRTRPSAEPRHPSLTPNNGLPPSVLSSQTISLSKCGISMTFVAPANAHTKLDYG